MPPCSALLPILALASFASSQQLQLSTDLTDPARNYEHDRLWGTFPLQLGPVTFPYLSVLGLLTLTSPAAPVLVMTETVHGPGSMPDRRAYCHAITRATMPSPARVSVRIAHSITPGSASSYLETAFVDLGADGLIEYSHTFANQPLTLQRPLLVDARGTPIEWQMFSAAAVDGMYMPWISRLELQFTEPVQEASYGPACAGELGCQRDPGNPWARTFIASFPNDSVLGWVFASDQQMNFAVSGVACPLLCVPAVVMPVALQPGANGRQFAVLDVALPPWPGLTWFAQGVALTPTVLVGTNGVRIQT